MGVTRSFVLKGEVVLSKKIEKQVSTLVEPLVERLGYTLYDVTFQNEGGEAMLDILIDRDGGITLDDCETVSREAEALLDEADPIPQSYCLCVSSPGADRLLRCDRHFALSLGKEIELKLYQKFEGKNTHIGELTGFTDDKVTIVEKTHTLSVPRKLISVARQYVRF